MSDTLRELAIILAQRKKAADPENSYVASLHAKGLNKILEKVGEEATEAILAAKDYEVSAQSPEARLEVIKETADLWFHTLVMLSHMDIDHSGVLEELQKRFKLSGLAEKASRS